MKKGYFSKQYGLRQAVLERRKTKTRRIIKGDFENVTAYHANGDWHFIADTKDGDSIELKPAFQIGEVVAVAQSYASAINPLDWANRLIYKDTPGWTNALYTRADLMPHSIRITDIKCERLQDISEEDAMREGVFKYDKPPLHHEADMFAPWAPYVRPYKWDHDNLIYRCTARYAFAYLIDKISGKGTWNRNPWVFAYEFELIN
jgi:hypothetical protein